MSKRLAELSFAVDDMEDGQHWGVTWKQSGINGLTRVQLHTLLMGAMQRIQSLALTLDDMPDDPPALLVPPSPSLIAPKPYDAVRAAEDLLRG